MQQTADWLEKLGMSEYAERFAENRIDLSVLPDLTDQDLKDLGIVLGDRRKMLRAIAALGAASALTGPQPAPAPPSAVAPANPPARSQPLSAPIGFAESAGERRYVTVMFCDLVGSTAISARLDAEEWRDLVGTYIDSASAAVSEMGGHVAKKLGDGILALFGYPVAHENDAERASRAALSILRALAELNVKHAGTGKPELQARIGLETGHAVLDAAGEIYGDVANIAARVQALAEPGAVLVTARVRRQVAGLFVAEERGTHNLKGVPEPLTLFRLVRASGGGRRSGQRQLTPLVGRDDEITMLMRRWGRARQGDGQLVMIVGEPGLGKSRLLEEFHSRLADTPHTWVEWSCSQLLQNSPLHPIAEWGRQRFGGADVPPAQRLAELESSLAQVKLDPAENVPLLAPLLDIPLPPERAPALAPEELRRRQLAALTNWVIAGAKVQSVVLAFEDLQWADPTTLDVLRGIAERGALAPLLVVATTRPEFRPPWGMRSHHGTISLAPLDRGQVQEMVAELSARHALPRNVVEDVASRTGGVPLFVEEVTRLLLERGEGGGGIQAIPATLQQSLMARLDRLGPAREVAQIGSVIGRGFSYALLRAVAGMEDEPLQAALDSLAEADILLVQGLPPDSDYRFKHALIQDAAYENLLKSRRQVLHRRVGENLRDEFAGTSAAQPELLARHFTQAGMTEAAVEWWQKAGQRALERSANIEAIAHLAQGIQLTRSLPTGLERDERELALQLALGPALMATRGYGAAEVEETYSRAHELCRHLGAGPDRFAVLRGLWEYYELRARMDTAKEIADEVFAIAERSGDRTLRLVAHDVVGDTSLWVGDFAAAVAHTQQAIELYDPERDRDLARAHGGYDPTMACRIFGAHALWYMGYPDRSLRQCQEAVAFARALDHPPTLAFVSQIAMHHQLRGEALPAETHAEVALDLAQRHDFKFWLSHATISHGWAVAAQGREQGIDEIRRGIDAYRATGAQLEGSIWAAMLADALLRHRRIQEALSILADALTTASTTGVRPHLAELHRLHGSALLLSGASPEEAETSFQHAVDVAQEQRGKSLELRASMSLARLWRDQGKVQQARELLAPVYGWFTEGFDTRDLKEAKALLEELGA